MTTSGRLTGTIGTLPNTVAQQPSRIAKHNPTTPDSLELQAIFSEMHAAGVTDVAMEVSSSALVNHRVDYCHFDIGVFTNLTHDHLEEHQTMENYKHAKFRLFNRCRYGLINADNPVAEELQARANCEVLLTYGIDKAADFRAVNLHYDASGVEFTLVFQEIIRGVLLAMPRRFNVYNCLAAIGACYLSGLSPERIIQGIAAIGGVPVSGDSGSLIANR
jgi:UDP-N-acetylmuramoyl-L-alanyl-D-glutamate--2,6-diaminopimelate ligase